MLHTPSHTTAFDSPEGRDLKERRPRSNGSASMANAGRYISFSDPYYQSDLIKNLCLTAQVLADQNTSSQAMDSFTMDNKNIFNAATCVTKE